ncbi:MAG TPA: ABC transporter substrate-binding protein [Pseudolabrys sp.]|jgi:putative ABC transport system substrate-binding protein
MRRREFITLLGGTVAAWPFGVRAIQAEPMKQIGVLNPIAADDKEAAPRVTAFEQRLKELGWTPDRNIRINYRWTSGGQEALQILAKELVELKPDVLVANATTATGAFRAATSSIPIVFLNVTDPIGPGFVESLARPGGNVTGFTNFEFSLCGKWLEILKEISPRVTRVAGIYNPRTAPYFSTFWYQVELAAASVGIKPLEAPFSDAATIESMFAKLASEPNAGLLVMPDISTLVHRDAIVSAAARHRLPAVYPYRFFASSGGLVSYGVDNVDQYRRTATYVDRILRGEKPADLPVQQPIKFELAINVKTAKALGLNVPPAMLAIADEVIE